VAETEFQKPGPKGPAGSPPGDTAEERGPGGDGLAVRYRRASPLASRRIAGETILVPIRGDAALLGSIYTLSPVAAAIWEELARPSDEEALVARLLADFEVDEATARADVRSFLATLREEGLADVDGGGA